MLVEGRKLDSSTESGCGGNQAFSRRLPTAVAQIQSQAISCGICGGHSDTVGGGSSSTTIFPASSHSTNCTTLIIIIILGWYNTIG
jgi:hypothetical protein